MKSLAKAARVNQAIEVIQHMNKGMTTVEACQEVGLPRSSYYDIIKNKPAIILARHQFAIKLDRKKKPPKRAKKEVEMEDIKY